MRNVWQPQRFLLQSFDRYWPKHVAAIALYAMHYNFCRVHETLRITPAMQLSVTDQVWSIGELIDAALDGEMPSGSGPEFPHLDPSDTIQSARQHGKVRGMFTVIEGGKT